MTAVPGRRSFLWSLVVALSVSNIGPTQGAQDTLLERYSAPIQPYRGSLGTFTRAISSSNPEAQAYFSQGFQMMWSFSQPEAVRSFREAWKRDPDCAICYWGEAWAWGSYLNAPMGEYAEAQGAYLKELDDHPHNGWSLLGLQQALRAQGKPTLDVDADLAASWARSDTWIRASRF